MTELRFDAAAATGACFGTPFRLRAIILRPALLVCFFALSSTAQVSAAESQYSATGPHADAIRLVSEKRADDILRLDGGGDARWFDTRERTWSVRRPVGPGFIDSRFLVKVTYAIDGKVVGEWSVNTCTGEVGVAGEHVTIEGCGPPKPAMP